MKNIFKVCLAFAVAAVIAVSSAVVAFAADKDWIENPSDGIYVSFKGSESAQNGEKPEQYVDEAAGTRSFTNNANGDIWGMYVKNVKGLPEEGMVVKVAYYMTIEGVNGGGQIKFKASNELYSIYNVQDLFNSDNRGKVIVVVARILKGDTELGLWPGDGNEGKSSIIGTLDKVVVAGKDYDFGVNQGEYKLIAENNSTEGGQMAELNAPAGSWTPSTMPVKDYIAKYEGDTLTANKNGENRGGVRNDNGTISLGTVKATEKGEVLWGYETSQFDTTDGSYTLVVKAKIVKKGNIDNETPVITVTPKLRWTEAGEGKDKDVAGTYTGERLENLKADEDGFVYLYCVINPEDYNSAEKLSVENRIWFDGTIDVEDNWQIDLYSMILYKGDRSADYPDGEAPTPPAEDPETPEKPSQTGDVSAVLAVLTAGAAVFGGLKLRRK